MGNRKKRKKHKKKVLTPKTNGVEAAPTTPSAPTPTKPKPKPSTTQAKKKRMEPPFPKDFVDPVFPGPETRPPCVVVAIHPGYGKMNFCFVSGFFNPFKEFVIAGLESFPTHNPSNYTPLLLNHLKHLLSRREFKRSLFVLSIENTGGFHATAIMTSIRDSGFDNVVVLREPGLRDGMAITDAIKREMAKTMRAFLASERIRLSDHLISVDSTSAVKELHQQMLEFRLVPSVVKEDGLCVAAQQALWTLREFLRDPKNANF